MHAHAHGQDPRTVQTQPIVKSLAADRAFEHDVLDPAEHRRTLLELAEEVAGRLRDGQQAASGLALSVRYADRSTSTRSRTLAEATAHTRPIITTAYELYDLLALQRARVRAIRLRAHDLRPASEATQQLILDLGDGRALAGASCGVQVTLVEVAGEDEYAVERRRPLQLHRLHAGCRALRPLRDPDTPELDEDDEVGQE
ncbi:hypothetical protein [Streptomyces virginiae]|uniref:DinB/UmuC family translesion DNA polymerase n=1 Tax=Streptomyces virginiae TaxID=1961 RepID=UPI003668776F